MKRLHILIAVIILMVFANSSIFAQVTSSANIAGVELVKILTITQKASLNFGVVGLTAKTSGFVVMSTSGERTTNAQTTSIINTGTPKSVAKFYLTGTSGDSYTIHLPETIDVKSSVGTGKSTATIGSLTVDVDGAGEVPYASIGTCTLTNGVSSFLLGGTLTITEGQVIDVYSGTFDVTVDYN